MTTQVKNFSKRFAEWATALWEKYGSDLFFRTTVNIVALQAFFVLACIITFSVALRYLTERWQVFGALLLGAVLFGLLTARLVLRPAYQTVRNQKLFMSNVAHELRTPLSTIRTSSEVALLDERLPESVRETFSEILEELVRISEILNNLLSLNSLTRPERMQFKHLDLTPIAERVLARHGALARERGITMTLEHGAGSLALGNDTALEQVMSNIVKNALSYTPAGAGGKVVVSLRPAPDKMVLFEVSDNGVGMSKEDLLHVLEPFYRADLSRTRKIQRSGAGLGLTIADEMVRAHGGRLYIESAPRRGTTVSVLLPRGGWQGFPVARRRA